MRILLLAVPLTIASLVCHGQDNLPVLSIQPDTAAGQPVAKELAPPQLAGMIGSPSVFVYDCNEVETYSEAHVPGAVLLVFDQVTLDKLPPDRNAKLVFYCYSPQCPAGAMAASTAMSLGFVDVYCMIEGITGWQEAGLPTEPKSDK